MITFFQLKDSMGHCNQRSFFEIFSLSFSSSNNALSYFKYIYLNLIVLNLIRTWWTTIFVFLYASCVNSYNCQKFPWKWQHPVLVGKFCFFTSFYFSLYVYIAKQGIIDDGFSCFFSFLTICLMIINKIFQSSCRNSFLVQYVIS